MPGRNLTVFYNASALPARPAGAGIYTLELAAALARRNDVELLSAAPSPYSLSNSQVRAGFPEPLRPAWEWTAMSRAIATAAPDLYHGAHFFTPRAHIPTVATVHDLTFFRIPGRYDWPHRHYYRLLARTARRASRIIVPSGAVASDVVRYLGYPPERIRVIAEAPRDGLAPSSPDAIARLRASLGIEEPYLLCLGTAEPGKRAVDAIRAMPKVIEAVPGAQLVLAGNPGRLSSALHREGARLGVQHAVHFAGYVDDSDLPALLTGATALIFPSLYEGFGLPPLEAMACGTPVIASDAPAMSEVLDGAATFVPIRNPDAIATEAIRLLKDPGLRSCESAKALEFASRFSWDRAAQDTVDVYRELVA
ncbi:MAG: glycosyltransferase family 4 protein [Dehalococcoidia bacterium]